jgi:hypothetical protein
MAKDTGERRAFPRRASRPHAGADGFLGRPDGLAIGATCSGDTGNPAPIPAAAG